MLLDMQALPENLDIFTLSGGIIAALSSLLTIGIAVNEWLKPSRIERKVSRIRSIIADEEDSGRISALRKQKLLLEASLFARDVVPDRQFFWIVIILLFPMARFIAIGSSAESLWLKIIILIFAAVMIYFVVKRMLDELLSRRILEIQYIAGQDPWISLADESEYSFGKNRDGIPHILAFSLSFFLVFALIFYSAWRGQSWSETSIEVIGVLTLNVGIYYRTSKEASGFMNKLAGRYVAEWDKEHRLQELSLNPGESSASSTQD